MSDKQPHILTFGLEAPVWDSLQKWFSGCKVSHLKSEDIEKLLDAPPEPIPVLILVGKEQVNPPPVEVAQFVRMQLQESMLFYITKDPNETDRADLVKNGFNDSFVLSVDSKVIETGIKDALAKSGTIKSYRSVKLMDIQPGSTLDFDVSIYLPANNKYIKVINEGDSIEAEKAERLAKHNVSSVHVTHDQIKKFYEYTSNQLKKISSNNAISETERREKMQGAVRNLLSGIISATDKEGTIDHGRAMVTDCQQIVKSFILGSDKGTWYQNLLTAAGEESGQYSHMSNVSTFCALFSMGTGIGKTEDMAVAGMMHDIGLAKIPIEIQDKPESQRTKEEQEIYKKHVDYTMEMIKQKKLILSDITLKAISQHHERFNGTGYPKGISDKKFCPEAQVLALADEFDKLTRVEPGRKRMTPIEAIDHIQRTVDKHNPEKSAFDPAIVQRLMDLFPR